MTDQWRLKTSWQLETLFRSLHAECERCLGSSELQQVTPSYVWDWFFDQSRALDEGVLHATSPSTLERAHSKELSTRSSSLHTADSAGSSNHLDGSVSRLMEWTLMIVELLENSTNVGAAPLDSAVRARLSQAQQLLSGLPTDLAVLATVNDIAEVVHQLHHVTETVCTDYEIEQAVGALLDEMTTVVEVTHSLVDQIEGLDGALWSIESSSPLAATAALTVDTLSVSAASTTVADGDQSPVSDADKTVPDRTNSGIRAELKSQSDHALQNDLEVLPYFRLPFLSSSVAQSSGSVLLLATAL